LSDDVPSPRSPFHGRSAIVGRAMLGASLVGAALFAGMPAAAKDYATRDVGAWKVAPSTDEQGCFITRTFDGARNTTLLLGLDTDGSNRLSLLNPNWSIRPKEQLKLNFRLSNAAFPRHLAVGITADGKRGFVTSFGGSFPKVFAASTFLHVTRGDVPVEELRLDGSGAAVAELRKCVEVYRRGPAAAPRAPADDGRIPVDPFAAGKKRDSRK
jgi:hypothetical protein